MYENEDRNHTEEFEKPRAERLNSWLGAVIVLLAIATLVTVIYGYKQQTTVGTLSAQNAQMRSTVTGLQDKIDSLTSKLNDMSAAQAAAAQAQAAASQAASAQKTPAAKRQSSAQSKRMKQMQAQIDDEAKQLKDTQDSLAQARTELQGNLDSTRDQLNGSIARTHEELVALEQRGERNYFEFDLSKSKGFQRTGPISVSLRKADSKHRSYDLSLLIDDNTLTKRSVNLYEPIWLSGSDQEQLQIVVNKIDKNHVHGYVSAPKYPHARMVPASAPVSGQGAASNSSPIDSGAASQPGENHLQTSPQ